MAKRPKSRKGEVVLIAELAAGATIREAAAKAKLSESTVYRRLQDDEFRREIKRARDRVMERSTARLVDATTAAVATLVELLDGESEAVRLAAARAIIDNASKLRVETDLVGRVQALEEKADANAPKTVTLDRGA